MSRCMRILQENKFYLPHTYLNIIHDGACIGEGGLHPEYEKSKYLSPLRWYDSYLPGDERKCLTLTSPHLKILLYQFFLAISYFPPFFLVYHYNIFVYVLWAISILCIKNLPITRLVNESSFTILNVCRAPAESRKIIYIF